MANIPTQVSEAFKRLNPHIFKPYLDTPEATNKAVKQVVTGMQKAFTPQKKRLRQDKLPNKLESDWQRHQEAVYPGVKFRPQALKFRIGSGAFYKPDLIAWMLDDESDEDRWHAWETKGPKEMKNTDRGTLAIKAAAAAWPEVKFTFVWRENGCWHQQVVLP